MPTSTPTILGYSLDMSCYPFTSDKSQHFAFVFLFMLSSCPGPMRALILPDISHRYGWVEDGREMRNEEDGDRTEYSEKPRWGFMGGCG
ncbi:hypothetical protein SK128_021916 [Halocaridina rubra]|uniref:Uncharacterized protein n=1 Tax=Halocaridina rubra TaxID=373956 RepID=A0AAN8WQW2_HALRR